ncbi:MAG TPA: MgtC/SapB family protein [Steroidobacteraceae bacterium]|nr:MgtC/SapB family protein [Steroidobacteraceae bacterium]
MPAFPPEPVLPLHEIALRLLVALACGAIIGVNRDFHKKPAGFRTFGLVGLGSGLVVLLMHQMAGSGPDAVSRVVQGVLTGIGFLGAGMIFQRAAQPRKVAGLTTAAAVWLTAGLGMAAGAGQLKLAGLGLLFGMLLLLIGGPCERFLERILSRVVPRNPKSDRQGPNLPPPDL